MSWFHLLVSFQHDLHALGILWNTLSFSVLDANILNEPRCDSAMQLCLREAEADAAEADVAEADAAEADAAEEADAHVEDVPPDLSCMDMESKHARYIVV